MKTVKFSHCYFKKNDFLFIFKALSHGKSMIRDSGTWGPYDFFFFKDRLTLIFAYLYSSNP